MAPEKHFAPAPPPLPSAKQEFLKAYDQEHAITMRVLRAYPQDKLELRPHPKCKTARELAWIFVLERGLGAKILNDEFASGTIPAGGPPPPPESWDELLGAIAKAHREFGELVRSFSDEKMLETVKFFTGPGALGDFTRLEAARFLLSDEIHHRGQFSVYLRMADGKVPSIYGPTADEPWM
jgi:uncharacterized damage-inducible protein DinB